MLCHSPPDLHVLGTPPALTLSQDQTLHKNLSPAKCHSHGIPPHQTPIGQFFKLLITLRRSCPATGSRTPRIVSSLLSCVFVCFCAVRAGKSMATNSKASLPAQGARSCIRLLKSFLMPQKGTLIF